MSYSLDLSSMLLGDLELFPECALPSALKDEAGDVFSPQSRGPQSDFSPSIHDDPFPDWLDLKMDLSFLEDLERTDDVLDDLLRSEVDVGQSVEALPALQVEDRPYTPVDLKHIPPEQISGNVDSLQVTLPLYSEAGCPTISLPPNSPECLVPEITIPGSPVYLGSLISSPSSPDCTLMTGIASPAPADTTLIAFVAPVIQPISVFNTGVEVQCMTVDVVSWPVAMGDQNSSAQTELQADLKSPCISSLPLDENTAKSEADRKRKATGLKKSLGNSKKVKLTCDDNLKPLVSIPKAKKERKRQQNKDAALRYRMKKKMETNTVSVEVGHLLERNMKLREKVQHLSTELGYLKKLMREMFKAKGLLN